MIEIGANECLCLVCKNYLVEEGRMIMSNNYDSSTYSCTKGHTPGRHFNEQPWKCDDFDRGTPTHVVPKGSRWKKDEFQL